MWILFQLFSLTAFIISVEDKLPVMKTFNSTVRVEGFPSGDTVPTMTAVGSSISASIASCSHRLKRKRVAGKFIFPQPAFRVFFAGYLQCLFLP